MTKKPLKKGNVYAHAKSSRTKVTFNKPAKKAPARKAAVKRAPIGKPASPKFRYRVQVKKESDGMWKTLLGSNSKADAAELARIYAGNYPTYWIRVTDK